MDGIRWLCTHCVHIVYTLCAVEEEQFGVYSIESIEYYSLDIIQHTYTVHRFANEPDHIRLHHLLA